MKPLLYSLLGATFLFAGCNNTPTPTPPTAGTDSLATAAANKVDAPQVDLTGASFVSGVLVEADDSGYPMAFLSVQSSAGDLVSIAFDQEKTGIKLAEVSTLKGKQVTAAYHSQTIDEAMDVHLNGKSLWGEDAPKMLPEWKKINGTLIAEHVSTGDTPDKMGLRLEDGTVKEYDYFILEEIAAAHGKKVDIYYRSASVKNELLKIDPVAAR